MQYAILGLTGTEARWGQVVKVQEMLRSVPALAPRPAFMKDDPVAARCVGDLADGGPILAVRIISDLLIPDATKRIAAVMLRATGAEEGIEPSHPDDFLMTRGELSEMANVSRPRVNRVLGELEAKGLIKRNHQRLRVTDAGALRMLAASGS
jgi:hypothetical protein